MKTTKAVPTCLVLMVFVYLFASPALSAEKTKISIQRFEVSENLGTALGGFLYDVLLERMVDSGKYTVVDWEELDRIQKYIADSQPNVSEKDAREQAGNQLGIEMIYVGSLKKVGSQYFISVKVLKLDLSVVDTENKFVKSEDDLWDGINQIADQLLGLSKEVSDATETMQAQKGRLFVETKPKDARVRILNIKPKFYQGIELEPGSYHVEVSASNYATKKVWVKLNAGEEKTVRVRLTEATAINVLQQAIGLYTGTAGHVDEEKARMLFIQAAEKNDPLARMWVARCYYKGRCGFTENESRGKEMAETVIGKVKALAAGGNTEAMFLLASAYHEGLAISEDPVQAVYWYRKAAQKNYALAMNNLGLMYTQGKGVAKDHTQAVYWYRKAAKMGETTAMKNLGVMYADGKGVKKDAIQAVYWYRMAGEKGHALAMNNLGSMYTQGKGVAQDATQAVYWYRKAAEKGYAPAMTKLGWMYGQGEGVAKDTTQEVYWYRKAAEKAHPLGMNNLGWMYEQGEGVAKDATQAVYWFRKAAEKGEAIAMNNVGVCYENGNGVTKDMTQAIYWYRKAAEKGYSPAAKRLKELGY